MIEVVYKKEKQEAENGENIFDLPKNIRQVGLTTGNMRIYIEDYAYTFLTRFARREFGSNQEQCCIAVLTGETKWNDGITYLFIRGALMVEDMEAAADHIDFSEKIWKRIQEDQTRYFPGQEITGWFFSRPQLYMEADELLTRIHLRHFGGEKVLMLMEPAEKEEAFFFYENGLMIRQRGYYIYYEKNPLMQEYMIEKNKDTGPQLAESVPDEAVVSFRRIIENKKTRKTEKAEKTEEKPQEEMEHASVFSYAATACLALAVLAVGAGFYRNYIGITDASKKDSTVTVTSESAVKEESVTPEITWIEEKNQPEDIKILDETAVDSPTMVPEVETTQKPEAGQKAEQDTEQITEIPLATEIPKEEEVSGNLQAVEEPQFSQEADERKIKKEEAVSSDNVHESYMIKPGDTLYQISISHYGSTDAVSEICRLNNLTENQVIYPGQMIVLP